MKALLMAPALVIACIPACASSALPAPATPSGVTAPQASNNPARLLDAGECASLRQWMADACQSRPNERSARTDGWCSDVLRGVENGAWVTGDCEKHITYIDSTCFRSTTNVHDMMACDESVSR